MNPLIDNFTNILKPCSGCGSNNVWNSIPLKENIMQYAVTVIVEADTLKAAVLKVPDDLGEVASATPRPQQPQKPQGMPLPSVLTNMRTGLPVEQGKT